MGLRWFDENISGQARDNVELVGCSRSIEGPASTYNDLEYSSFPTKVRRKYTKIRAYTPRPIRSTPISSTSQWFKDELQPCIDMAIS
jgi:hypothetical protein